jgi:hypothetical protein
MRSVGRNSPAVSSWSFVQLDEGKFENKIHGGKRSLRSVTVCEKSQEISVQILYGPAYNDIVGRSMFIKVVAY